MLAFFFCEDSKSDDTKPQKSDKSPLFIRRFSETWLAEGVEMAEDEAPDPEIEAAKIGFVCSVFVVNAQTHAFLQFVQSDFVGKCWKLT